MLEAGCNPNYKMPDGSNWTVLMLAAYAGHEELVQKFSKGGKGVSDKDSQGFQAMMLAALKGHTFVCRCLLDKKADPNANNEYGETPLMMAAAMGHKDVVSLLLDSGADANARDANEMSAVKKASRWGHVECLKTLLPKVNKEDIREMKHCLLFGKLYDHPEAQMPRPVERCSKSTLDCQMLISSSMLDKEARLCLILQNHKRNKLTFPL